ncbi:MAG: glycerophosphodiester phosphodiesterase [Lachnospiraceae bacterium]|nr:glycerophosphodiester phosphodiesterase [Lachnospiraceae bacterium]
MSTEDKRTLVWGHRGASGYAPENTLDSFEKAIELDADGVELDVQLTKDGEIVVIHDETVDRVSGAKGYVKDTNFDDIRKLDVSLPIKDYAKRTRIPTLEEVLNLIKGTKLTINIELKTGIFAYEGIEKKVIDLVNQKKMMDDIWFSSFNHESVLRVKKICSEAKCGLLIQDIIVNPCAYLKGLNAGIEALHPAIYHYGQDPLYIKKAKEAGLCTHIWTVNEREHMEMLCREGVEAIITNYPDIAVEVVGK